MNIPDDYIPIVFDTIQYDTTVGCDLYLQNSVDGKINYILYCSGKSVIKFDKIEELHKNKITRLFVRKEEHKTYLKYVESCLRYIIDDDKIPIEPKVHIVYGVAKNIMMDLLGDPRSGEHIKRAKNWIDNVIYMIMSKSASKTILDVLSYDYYTWTHSVNVTVLGLLFSKYLDINHEEMHAIGTGFLLHDIGKTQIDPEIITKKSRLTDDEFVKVQMHVEFGADILTKTKDIDTISFIPVMQHHEKYNGKGYPKGLKGDGIHLYGKIASIIDVYDALTTRRSYADARKPFVALQIMNNEMKGSFDVEIFKDFILFLGSQGEKKS